MIVNLVKSQHYIGLIEDCLILFFLIILEKEILKNIDLDVLYIQFLVLLTNYYQYRYFFSQLKSKNINSYYSAILILNLPNV